MVFDNDIQDLSATRLMVRMRGASLNPRTRILELSFVDACKIIQNAVIGTEFQQALLCPVDFNNRLLPVRGMLSLRDAFDAIDTDNNERLSAREIDTAFGTVAATPRTTIAVARGTQRDDTDDSESEVTTSNHDHDALPEPSSNYKVYGERTRSRPENEYCEAATETQECKLRCFQPLPFLSPPPSSPPPNSPPNPPPPPPVQAGNNEVMECFPGHATVMTKSGVKKSMSEVHIGDEVAVATSSEIGGETKISYERILSLSHANRQQVSDFVTFEIDEISAFNQKNVTYNNKSSNSFVLSLTDGHLLPAIKAEREFVDEHVLKFDQSILVEARDLSTGDIVFVASRDMLLSVGAEVTKEISPIPMRITSVSSHRHSGLYNPHTKSGTIIVDGVVASCYTSGFDRTIADIFLSPAHIFSHLFGAWEAFTCLIKSN